MSSFTIQDFLNKKKEGKKITMLTAYDYPFARIVDEDGKPG
jgi:3-methyl-2-oxobutanoate hydroxymethyltransferase